jgi:hypothetical protein
MKFLIRFNLAFLIIFFSFCIVSNAQYKGGSYDGYYSVSDSNLALNGSTNIKVISGFANNFELYQNYPNPFNPATIIKFSLLKNSSVTIKVFDITGKLVQVLIDNKNINQGNYEITFNGNNFNSGIYFYKLEVRGISSNQAVSFSETKKMLLAK